MPSNYSRYPIFYGSNKVCRSLFARNATLDPLGGFAIADLAQADLTGMRLSKADLRYTDLHGAKWQEIAEIKLANVFGVKNAPPGFLQWAAKMGAVSIESDAGWLAQFHLD